MKKNKYREDLHKRLQDPDYAEGYLNAALEEALEDGDVSGLMLSIRNVIDATRGISEIHKKLEDVSRTSLYKTLSEGGNPEFSTVLKILKALKFNLRLQKEPKKKAS